MKKTLTALAAATLLLAGCGDTSDLGPGSEPDPAEQDTSSPATDATTDETEAPDDLEVDEGDETEGQYLHELDEPVVYESNGIRLSITGVGFTDATSDVAADVRDFLEDDTETIVAMEMTVSNDSGEEISIFANQGSIHIGRTQVDASIFLSDSFGSEMRDGVDDDGLVVWELAVPFDEVVSAGTLTYSASAPFSEDTFESVGDDVELTVEWPAP